jgi:hypothetical protein
LALGEQASCLPHPWTTLATGLHRLRRLRVHDVLPHQAFSSSPIWSRSLAEMRRVSPHEKDWIAPMRVGATLLLRVTSEPPRVALSIVASKSWPAKLG